jgi:hypothetical protein
VSETRPAAVAAEVPPETSAASEKLEQGTYEILRGRLAAQGAELRRRLEQLNRARQEVFGALSTALVATERITTHNNCLARDLVPIGANRFLFGYNVHVGLRSEVQLGDVFAVYEHREHRFVELPLDIVADPQFVTDFRDLYRYYKHAVFAKFTLLGPHLFMEFRVGKSATDIKTFKWLCDEGALRYLGNRSDHEYTYPPAHDFEWTRTHRELHRHGLHPHVSIHERVFVECIGGDLTVKIEDNTATGQGIYCEPVEHRDQTLDDAEIFFAILGHLILLKIRPYAEKEFRYLVFNEKLKEVRRIDPLGEACVTLPDAQGLIFPCGYYLQSGVLKLFETQLSGLVFHKRIASPNGEDVLFTFYQRDSGDYVLFSYNVIRRIVEAPILCGGFSIFDNGEMAVFRSEPEPQRHHLLQIWQTPYVAAGWQAPAQTDNFLYKLGNAALVRCMAECQELLALTEQDDSYAGLYLDLVRQTGQVLDAYFWLDRPEVCQLKGPLMEIRAAAQLALAEFDKVTEQRRVAVQTVNQLRDQAAALLRGVRLEKFERVGQFVERLAQHRTLRGELLSARELRYADHVVLTQCEQELVDSATSLAQRTAAFLLEPNALQPYRQQCESLLAAVPTLPKAQEGVRLEEAIVQAANELDLLVETVTGLKIQDGTETTRIVEAISAIYATLNQARAALKLRLRELRGGEAVSEFASQLRLLDQAQANYLELCREPERCDELLNRLLVQLEELEARFADFDEFVVQLSEKRLAIAAAFEGRKLELVEARNRKTSALLTAAERILKGIRHRAERLASLDEINGYFAADAMVEKVRDLVRQLLELGDSVKADDVQTRLKTLREEAGRQLRDRLDLSGGQENCLQLGRHQFLVNTQELDLTIVPRGEQMCLHVTGTSFFEPIDEAEFLATRPVWSMDVVSETPTVYRSEWLAYRTLAMLQRERRGESARAGSGDERLAAVREVALGKIGDGYVKGVHDLEAAEILGTLLELDHTIGLLRYAAKARALAEVFWLQAPDDVKSPLAKKLRALGALQRLFPSAGQQLSCTAELRAHLAEFVQRSSIFEPGRCSEAAEFLGCTLKGGSEFCVAPQALALAGAFDNHVREHRFAAELQEARQAAANDVVAEYETLRAWVAGYASAEGEPVEHAEEAAVLLLRGSLRQARAHEAELTRVVRGLKGTHPRVEQGTLPIHFVEFMARLRAHAEETAPLFERCQELKRRLIEQARRRLRLDDFKPRVLTSFVRNRLIDSVYLPMVGDNLAKQIGAAGEGKRTDRMGMLLLISPPGYGKTTLLEYIASRLGIVFLKINGPAIGPRVTSFDPAEATSASARDELSKLNLAFELGDNVMVCLDDIQHLHPEFLQKFISLCDAQRRIEGVYRGHARTYDLRGKKVAVVMAGNPYTESGERFQIPDMLANRADTYNLGDVLGGHEEAFRLSYLENAAGSNPVLAPMAARAPADLHAIIRLAQPGGAEGAELVGNWSPDQLSDAVNVMKKLVRVRDVVLRVNELYIQSASQADAYRTEPPFRLQGSYRNMNRLAEKISPIMNEVEVQTLLEDHYRNEAQTLAKGAEANLLKFKELLGTLSSEGTARWEEIKRVFRKNLLLRSNDSGRDPVSQVVEKLHAFYEGLDAIKEVLASAAKQRPLPAPPPPAPPVTLIMGPPAATAPNTTAPKVPTPVNVTDGVREVRISPETLRKIWDLIETQEPPPPAADGEKAPIAPGPAPPSGPKPRQASRSE